MDISTQYHFRNNFFEDPRTYNDLMLYQIGELLCDVNAKVDNHLHGDFYEFTYVISGNGEIYTNNKGTPVGKSDLYFSHPDETHRIVSQDNAPLRYIFVAFNVDDSSPLKPLLTQSRVLTKDEKKRVYHTESILIHLQHLLSEISKQATFCEMIIEHELKTVILKALRLIMANESIYYQPRKNTANEQLCFKIINYIDNNVMTIDSASALSGILGYNYTYLSRIFRKKTGDTISSYIQNKKMDIAKRMLENTDVSVTDIANELNYSSIHVFSRAFKEKFNITPTDYRINAKALATNSTK